MTESLKIPAHIFKSYDIRGLMDSEITESIAELIGAAAVETLSAKKLAVGRDMREHGPRLESALVGGITGAGADVILIGQCSTPMSYYAAATLDMDGAIMVTASHNPSEYNGFKFSNITNDCFIFRQRQLGSQGSLIILNPFKILKVDGISGHDHPVGIKF